MVAFQLAVMNEEGWGKILGTLSTADVYWVQLNSLLVFRVIIKITNKVKKRPFNSYSSINRVHSGYPYVQERRQELCSGHVINFLLTTTVFKVLFLFCSWGKWVLGPYIIYVITKLEDSEIWAQIVRTTVYVYTGLISNSGPLQESKVNGKVIHIPFVSHPSSPAWGCQSGWWASPWPRLVCSGASDTSHRHGSRTPAAGQTSD